MPNCRLCEKDGEEVVATRRIEGTDYCAECAASIERAEVRSRPVIQNVSKSEALLQKLNGVLDKAISGTIEPQQVNAICKVSNSMLQLIHLQLQARKNRGE